MKMKSQYVRAAATCVTDIEITRMLQQGKERQRDKAAQTPLRRFLHPFVLAEC